MLTKILQNSGFALEPIAWYWLGDPFRRKYRFSKREAEKAHPGSWSMPFSQAIRSKSHGLDLRYNSVSDLRGLVDVAQGKVNWKPDPFFQLWDVVLPPLLFLEARGDDCDGMAMFFAQAVDFALSGWRGHILSYLAADFKLSHHVCMAVAPDGKLFAIQPYPSVTQDQRQDPLVAEPFKSYEQAANEVASWYGTKPVAFDVRDSRWNTIEPWRKPK